MFNNIFAVLKVFKSSITPRPYGTKNVVFTEAYKRIRFLSWHQIWKTLNQSACW